MLRSLVSFAARLASALTRLVRLLRRLVRKTKNFAGVVSYPSIGTKTCRIIQNLK